MNKPSRLSVRIITRRDPPQPVTPPLWPHVLRACVLVIAAIIVWWAGWQVLQ